MGYTHYWSQKRNFTADEWAQTTDDLLSIVKLAQYEMGITLANGAGEGGTSPDFFPSLISFNGLGDDAHETFSFKPKKGKWDFCKTARKPYDVAVTACLCYFSSIVDIFDASSDGKGSDWLAGLELAKAAIPRLANHLDIPLGVMQADRWCAPWVGIQTDDFEVRFCVDGFGYVIKSTGETFRFPSHLALARWLESCKVATFACGGKTSWGEYGKVEENIWKAYGSFDSRRTARIAKAQVSALKTLFPVPAENAHRPPAFVRPGEMPENSGREFCYSVTSLLALAA